MRAFPKRGLKDNVTDTFSIFLCYTAELVPEIRKQQLIKWTDLIALCDIQAGGRVEGGEGGSRRGRGKEIKRNITL